MYVIGKVSLYSISSACTFFLYFLKPNKKCMTVSLKITLQHFHVHKQLYLTTCTYYIQQIHITKNKANSSLKVYYETRKDYKNVYIINKI